MCIRPAKGTEEGNFFVSAIPDFSSAERRKIVFQRSKGAMSAIITTDTKGTIVSASAAAASLFGFSFGEPDFLFVPRLCIPEVNCTAEACAMCRLPGHCDFDKKRNVRNFHDTSRAALRGAMPLHPTSVGRGSSSSFSPARRGMRGEPFFALFRSRRSDVFVKASSSART